MMSVVKEVHDMKDDDECNDVVKKKIGDDEYDNKVHEMMDDECS